MSGSYFQPIKREFLNLSGGTVTGNTVFTQGLYASTLSGGTIYSGSTNLYDIFLTPDEVTGTTLSEGTNINLQQIGIDYKVSVVNSPSFDNIYFSGLSTGGDSIASNISATTRYYSASTPLDEVIYNIAFSIDKSWITGSSGINSIKAINSSGLDSVGNRAVAWGNQTLAFGDDSTAFGVQTSAMTFGSIATGLGTISNGIASHAEGNLTTSDGGYSHAEGNATITLGYWSHAEGKQTISSGDSSHAEGEQTTSLGQHSHAEGYATISHGDYSHSEGGETISIGILSHAEGFRTTSIGDYSHSQGSGTTAQGLYSFASGIDSIALTDGTFIHSENSIVSGQRSVVLGGKNINGFADDTVYIPYLNLNYIPNINNLNTEILSRNSSTGDVEYTPLSAFTSLDTFVTGFTYNPTTNTFRIAQNQGQTDLTAQINSVTGLTISTLTPNRVVYVGDIGNLADDAGFEYNNTTSTLVVNNAVLGIQGQTGTTVTVYGDVLVIGDSISGFTEQLYIEDNKIELNYNPTASTTSTSLGAGISIKDGSGVTGIDVFFDIRGTGITISNRGFATNLNDIYIRETGSINAPNGVRVIAEYDELDGGVF